VRLVRQLRKELGTKHGTIQRVAEQIGCGNAILLLFRLRRINAVSGFAVIRQETGENVFQVYAERDSGEAQCRAG
jgi:UPF0716 family protein affecting phage T7 exclusion